LLLVVSELKIAKYNFVSWNECLGSFLQVLGPEKFFRVLPLRLLDVELTSLNYALDSRSYLLQIVTKYLKKADLVYFI
jgi:hypothetical protein